MAMLHSLIARRRFGPQTQLQPLQLRIEKLEISIPADIAISLKFKLGLECIPVLDICKFGEDLRKTLTSEMGLDDMSLAYPAVVQLLVFIYSGIQ